MIKNLKKWQICLKNALKISEQSKLYNCNYIINKFIFNDIFL